MTWWILKSGGIDGKSSLTSKIATTLVSIKERVLVKVIADFSACLQFRHPGEIGGSAFTVSTFWAQVFPFVALQIYDGDVMTDKMKENTTIFLDKNTFYGTTTAQE